MTLVRSSRNPARLATTLFRSAYGSLPTVGASAPGRVNLIGEHVDYNGGPVLPAALDRRTVVVASPADAWEFASTEDDQLHRRDVEGPMRHEWPDYLVGVLRELRALDAAPAGARVAVATTLPIGAGLSSSAALTVAAAKALSQLAGRRLPPDRLAEVAYRAEHDQVGVRCGRMDQTIAAHARAGTALLFDTLTGERRHVPLPGTVWIVETGVAHRLTGGELNRRRAECEDALARCRALWPELQASAALSADALDPQAPPPLPANAPRDAQAPPVAAPPEPRVLAELPLSVLPAVERALPEPLGRRVRHVVTEVARTRSAAEALAAGDLAQLGELLLAGHASLRKDYESTVPEADLIVESAARHGAYGARLTGAGWGGAVLVLAPRALERAVLAGVAREFAAAYGREPAIWGSRAAGGVRREAIRA